MTTLAQALELAQGLGLARLDAQLLLLHVLRRPPQDRAWVVAHDRDTLDAAAVDEFLAIARRRQHGEPVAYLVGFKEFYGMRLAVDPRVLVPRPDTETLVDWALEVLGCAPVGRAVASERSGGAAGLPSPTGVPAPAVVDLGTGSGAIALAIKRHCPRASVDAVDASERALTVAAANAASLHLQVRFLHGSWLSACDRRYDLIVSNPPYIPADDEHLANLVHEPMSALASGPDGLDAIRAIIAQAPAHLNRGAFLLIEHGWDQAPAVAALLERAGFGVIESRKDLAGIDRCTGGQWPEHG